MSLLRPTDTSLRGRLRHAAWVFAAMILLGGSVEAQTTLYWDVNSTSGGATNSSTAAGTWSGSGGATNWTTNQNGASNTSQLFQWDDTAGGKIAVFSASNDASGTFTVSTSGTINDLAGISFQEGAVTIASGGTLTLSQNATFAVTSTGNATINATIAGGFGITKTGNRMLRLGAANTFTGNTTLTTGTLQLANTNALQNSTLILNGGTLAVSGITSATLGGLSGSTNLTINNLALTIGNNNASTSYTGVLSGTGTSLTKVGSGTLTLGNTNNYGGATTITNGKLVIGSAVALGGSNNAAANLVIDGGTLAYQGAANTVSNRSITIGTSGATIESSGTGAFEFSNTGSMAYSGSGARTLTLTGSSTAQNEFNLTIADGTGGPTTLVKNGTGTWVIDRTAVNTYTGDTVINSGTLMLSNKAGKDATGVGNIIIGNGTDAASLTYRDTANQLNNTANVYLNSNGTYNLNGFSDTLGLVADGANTTGGFGQVQLGGGTLTVGAGNPSGTFSGVISGTGAVVANGTGTWTLAGNNTFSGGLTLQAGTLGINNAGALGTGTFTVQSGTTFDNTSGSAITNSRTNAIAINGNVTFGGSNSLNLGTGAVTLATNTTITTNGSGVLTLGGAASNGHPNATFTKAGTGALTLSGANGLTGTTTLSGGILNLNNAGALGSSAFVIQSGTMIDNTSAGAITLGGSGGMTWAGSFNFGGTQSLNTGAQAISLSAPVTVTTGALGSGTFTVGGSISGANSLTKAGTGTMVLGANNSYSGGTTISAGTLQVGNGGTTGTLGSGAVTNNATLQANRSDAATFANNIGGSGTLVQSGSGTLVLTGVNTYSGTTTISSGTLQVGDGGTTGTLGTGAVVNDASLVGFRSDTSTFNNNISGSGSLTQAGSGTLVLTGANSYSGATNVNAGTLQVGNGGTSGTLGTGAVTNNAALVFNRSDAVGVNNAISGSGTTSNAGSGTLTLSGSVTGSGSIAQTGSGTLVLAGTNSYSGTTTISSGTLQVGNGGTTGSLGTGAVTNNAALVFNRSDSTAVSNAISGTGTLTKDGAGTLSLTGANTYAGTTTISAGTLQVGNGGTSGSLGTGAVTNNATLAFNRTDTISVDNTISGSGNLVQTGSGTTILGGTNNYSGGTTINAGTLRLASTSGMGASGSAVNLNGGTWDIATPTALAANYAVTVGGTSTILSNRASAGAGFNHQVGTLSIGTQTLNIGAGANVTSGTAGVTFGATTLTGSATFNIDNGAASTTSLTLGALNDGGVARALTKTGNGTLSINAAASSLGNGTAVAVNGGTLSLAASGALGTLANVTVGSGGTLSVGAANTVGGLNGSGTVNVGSSALTVGSTNNLNSTFSGALQGTGSLNKAGTGTLTLSGSNSSFAGTINVNAGTLVAQNNAALGGSAAFTNIASGASLGLANNITLSTGNPSPGAIKAIGTGVGGAGAITNVSGTNTLATNLTLLGDTTIGVATGNLTLSGLVNLDSAAPNSTLTIAGGTGTTTTISGQITDQDNYWSFLNLALTGNGTLVLSNTGNNYWGNTTIGAAGSTTTGVIRLGASNTLPTANPSSLINVFSGTLDLNNFNATAYGLNLGGGGAGSTANINTGTGTLALIYGITYDATNNPNGATISGKLALSPTPPDTTLQAHTVTVGDSTATTSELTISADISDSGNPATASSILKYGAGTLTLSGTNTYLGVTEVQQGRIVVQNSSALGATGSSAYSSVSAGGTLELGAGGMTINESLRISGQGLGGNGALRNSVGNNTWTGGITLYNPNARIQADAGTALTISGNAITAVSGSLQVGGAGNVIISSAIGTSVLGVTKVDSGTLTLSGANSYTGNLNAQGGLTVVEHQQGLSLNSTAFVSSGASLAFNGGVTTLNTANVTLNVTGNGVNTGGVDTGAIRGLSGSNTFRGNVVLAGNTLITANAGNSLTLAGTGATISGAGTTLTVGSSSSVGGVGLNGNVTLAAALSGMNLVKNGAVVGGNNGTLAITGGGNIGTVALNEGKMVVSGPTLNTGDFTAAAGTSLLIAAGGTVNVTGDAVFNSATLDGSTGTLQVNGQNSLTFNGTINATGMTLVLNGGSVGTNAAPLTVFLGGANVNVGTIVITGDTILDFGDSAGTVLSSLALDIQNGAKVQVVNWMTTANQSMNSTVWYAYTTVNNTTQGGLNHYPTADNGGVANSDLGQITFIDPQGSQGNTTTWVADTSQGWFSHEIRPTPEPSTYGAMLMSGCLGLLGYRHYRRRKALAKAAAVPAA